MMDKYERDALESMYSALSYIRRALIDCRATYSPKTDWKKKNVGMDLEPMAKDLELMIDFYTDVQF